MIDDMRYTMDNEYANDEWTGEVAGQPISGKVIERISKDSLQNVTVDGCLHATKLKDPTDETEHYYALICATCPMGWLVAKESK